MAMTDVRIITEPLGGSPLSRLIQDGGAPATWMPPAPRSREEWRARATERAGESGWGERWAALMPALDATGRAAERLERVRRDGGIVVTTGQQPGLFGGPVYTWSKAMGALALADEIERETGLATAAIFWAATDDADFLEASHTMIALNGGAETLRAVAAPATGTPMSLAQLGDLSSQLARLHAAAGSVADPRALAAVDQAYGDPAATVGGAYVALLRAILAPMGMPVLDASHAAVRSASDSTLRAALRAAEPIERALSERSSELRAAGYAPQVEDMKTLSLVFAREGSIKRRIAVAEARQVADDETAWLMPNVLLRPIVECAILPTVAYLGGPGELAYFVQVSAVAQTMGVRVPLGVPRWSCTMIEPQIHRLLESFGVSHDALAIPDALEGAVARSAMSDRSSAALAEVRRAVTSLPVLLAEEAEPLGLGAAVQGSVQSLHHRLDRLERRLVAGIKRREHARLRDVATLRAALYPRGIRQERALNLVPMLSRHGLALLDEMREAASAHAASLVTSPHASS
jgi:bacillithiol biosynthesis cysteine-adding enzyme BshC